MIYKNPFKELKPPPRQCRHRKPHGKTGNFQIPFVISLPKSLRHFEFVPSFQYYMADQ